MVKKISNPTQILHPQAKLPTRATDGSAGYDFCCVGGIDYMLPDQLQRLRIKAPATLARWQQFEKEGVLVIQPNSGIILRLGLVIAIEPGHACYFWDRSGMSSFDDWHRFAGVIDDDYRGEWLCKLFNHSSREGIITLGQAVIQGVFQERIEAEFPTDRAMNDTGRGTGGHGHSGH
jgi:dUTP pyrophosphatase